MPSADRIARFIEAIGWQGQLALFALGCVLSAAAGLNAHNLAYWLRSRKWK